jgi:hypothetical protein
VATNLPGFPLCLDVYNNRIDKDNNMTTVTNVDIFIMFTVLEIKSGNLSGINA